MKRTVSMLLVTLLLVSMFTAAFSIRAAETGISQLTVPDEPAAIKETVNLASQEAPPTEWNRTYGGTGDESAQALVQTSDGGYALAGVTGSFGAGESDFWLVKTDANGNEEWNKTYGGTGSDFARALVRTVDGGYALAGSTASFGAGYWDIWLVKIDAAGNEEWNQTYGGTSDDGVGALVQTVDGGYALAGGTYSFGAGSSDFWLVKTDAAGTMQWNRTYGGIDTDRAYALVETVDGGYALAGHTYSFGAGESDFWLVKTDASGNAQWNKTYGGTSWDDESAQALVRTSDGGYALAGGAKFLLGENRINFWLVKTDASGNAQWNKTYGGIDVDVAYALVQTVDGGYALAGQTSLGVGSGDFWLVKIGKAEGGTIYIRADGSIDPPDAPISTVDNITYILTGDVTLTYDADGIVIERNNITFDGAGHTLQGKGEHTGITLGIDLTGRSNVIVKNMHVRGFIGAICLHNSSNNSIFGNYMANNDNGIYFELSSNNIIYGNNIAASIGNGIHLYCSSGNIIYGNNITDNTDGICFEHSSNNKSYHNNIINNTNQVSLSYDSANVWDDGYPSGGNYWSDYSGIDEKNGPNQDQPGSDGIGDTPYIIDVDNRDRYPLMIPWVAQHDVAITNVASCKTVVSQGYSLNMNVTAANQGSYVESFFDVYVYASNLSSTYQIGLQTITLDPDETAVLTFTWNTHDLAKGNYTLWAYAEPVVNETETADNTYTDGVVTISTQGDINADGIIDIFDITIVALAFGSKPGDSNWNPVADINNDGTVDIFDIVVVALHFGETS